MTANISINGETYMPIAAIPYVTGGFFTLGHVADLIANYESFCDRRNSTVLSPYKITKDGKLIPVASESFIPIADAWSREGGIPDWDVSDLVVPANDVRALMNVLVDELAGAGNLDPKRPPASWNPDAVLPAGVRKDINEHIRKPLNRTISRKNSRGATLEKLRDAVNVIVQRAARHGVSVHVGDMPGHKHDFVRILRAVDPKIGTVMTTLDRHYFPQLGLRWRRGARREAAAQLLAVFGLSVPPQD